MKFVMETLLRISSSSTRVIRTMILLRIQALVVLEAIPFVLRSEEDPITRNLIKIRISQVMKFVMVTLPRINNLNMKVMLTTILLRTPASVDQEAILFVLR